MSDTSNTEKCEIVRRACYTIDDLTVILDISRRSVMDLLNQKLFPWHRIGNNYRIPIKAFHQWLEQSEQQPNTQDEESPSMESSESLDPTLLLRLLSNPETAKLLKELASTL